MGVNISRDLGNTPRPESTSCVNNKRHRKSANPTDFQSDVQIGLLTFSALSKNSQRAL